MTPPLFQRSEIKHSVVSILNVFVALWSAEGGGQHLTWLATD
jgi:hypothetical protein